jgi:hypothetical protein
VSVPTHPPWPALASVVPLSTAKQSKA